MDCIDAANEWSEAARQSPFLTRNLKDSARDMDMGSLLSLQHHQPQTLKRPGSRESVRAPKRQRIAINDLVEKLEKDSRVIKEPAVPKVPVVEPPPSLAITLRGILDKYGDEHESLIPRRLDGVRVKTRCSVQIYYSTTECQNGTLTNIHEELLRVSQEGEILTAWNPHTGLPETEIHLPRSFVIPIRELYVAKPPPPNHLAGVTGTLFGERSEISDSDDDSDDFVNQGTYGFADKYFCHFSFSTVRAPPWPPLGLDSEISRNSTIGLQLKHRLSHKRDLKLVSRMELVPSNSLSMKTPLEIKLGPDRQFTQYQLSLDTKWTMPEVSQQAINKPKAPTKPSCIWRIEIGGQAPSVSKLNDISCGFCLTRCDSVKLLHYHLRSAHSRFDFNIMPSTTDKQCFVITVSDKTSIMPATVDTPEQVNAAINEVIPANVVTTVQENAPVKEAMPANVNTIVQEEIPIKEDVPANVDTVLQEDIPIKEASPTVPEGEVFRSIFDFDDELSSPCDGTPEPLPLSILQPASPQRGSPELGEFTIGSPASATTSEAQSKKSSPNTTPDSGPDSDGSPKPWKRTRNLRAQSAVPQEDDDSSEEDTAPKTVVPKTVKPLYDIASKRVLKPGEPLPPSTVSYEWRIRKHKELTNDFIDITPEEKDFINQWDEFMFRRRSTSKVFMPSNVKEFITINRRWLDEESCRKLELLKLLMTLVMSGRIEENSYWECLEMFQGARLSPRKSRANAAKRHRKSFSITQEETLWIELWDSYVKNSQTTKALKNFLSVCNTLCTERSLHASSPDQAMLCLFLNYKNRTTTHHLLKRDSLFYNSSYPHPATTGELEYVRYFNSFAEKFIGKDESSFLEQLVFSFFAENTEWLKEEAGRIKWAKKHLQELHWDKQINIKFREKCLIYLEIVDDTTYDSDREDKNKTATHAKLPFRPPPTENDLIQGPRPRNVRAFGECECGGHARAGEAVMCSGAKCIARVYHRACVPNAPARGMTWYCPECAKTDVGNRLSFGY